jgi:hypothetical protein
MPEAATLPRAGLFTTAAAPVPLTGVSIEADVSNLCARVVITQRYVNREDTPIEAVYLFPLDEGAAVCGFEALVDGTLVVGEVKEREEAFAAYDEAMQRGDGAFLLDAERPDVFQASVGNLLPGTEAMLRLTYVTELGVDGRDARLVVPTTVSPRYAPAPDRRGIGRPDAEALNPPRDWKVPYGLNLTVRLTMSGGVGRVESPSHPIALTLDGGRASVTLSQDDAALDRDFVLAIGAEVLARPEAWIERGEDGTGAVAVAFVPDLPDVQVSAEVIFLVDRSGSMSGSSLEEVRNALQLCLRSLTEGCHFNVIGFGSTTEALFPESRAYDEASLHRASAHVAAMDADLGGTDILPALQLALDAPRHPSLVRQVVVLTDGQVTNTDAVLALAREHAAHTRIFTFGIGAGASHHLVRGLARAGGGSAEFIFPGERIEPKVVRQVGRLLGPAIADVRVDWGGLEVRQVPSVVPPVFAGGRLLVYGFLQGEVPAGGLGTVRLTGESSSGPVAFDVALDAARVEAGTTVATLAARARIRELEEGSEWLASRGSRQHDRKATGVRREIIELAVAHGLVSRETSYVAVEKRDTPVVGDVHLRRVPIALTTGWGGTGRMPRLFPWQSAVGLTLACWSHSDSALHVAPVLSSPLPARGRRQRASGGGGTASASSDPMHALVALQRADGSWDLTVALAAVLGYDEAHLASLVGEAGAVGAEARAAWATALALAWLERHAADRKDQWRLLARKARAWLDRVPAAAPGGGSWLDAAEAFVQGERAAEGPPPGHASVM